MLDVFYVPLVTGKQEPFLSMLDDASVYHIARHLIDMTSATLYRCDPPSLFICSAHGTGFNVKQANGIGKKHNARHPR